MQIVHHDACETAPLVEPGRVDVYHLDFTRPWREDLPSLLNADERVRRNRYAIDAVRQQFAHTRGCLRIVLGQCLGVPPDQVVITLGSSGKPVVEGVHFNVSHSGHRGVIAVASAPVGIDIEMLRPMPNAAGLVRRFFSAREVMQFEGLPEELKLVGFFRGWTAKEALLKAAGVGLRELEDCVVDLDPRRPVRIVKFDSPIQWQLSTIVESEAVISIAVACEPDAQARVYVVCEANGLKTI